MDNMIYVYQKQNSRGKIIGRTLIHFYQAIMHCVKSTPMKNSRNDENYSKV
jgi:hypothetical protein